MSCIKNQELKEIVFNSEDYNKELILRDKVLRKPLGLSLFNENLEGEEDDIHLGIFIYKDLKAVLILSKLDQGVYKMRQVAVEPGMQRRGIGKQLVRFSEEYIRGIGGKKITLHARATAIPFYEKLGYQAEADEFIEVTIPHRTMNKDLC